MATAVARPDLLDPEAPDLRRSVRLRHAPRGDEGPRDGAGRRRQVVRTTRRDGRALARQGARIHLVGPLPGEPGATSTEPVAPRGPGCPEARRGAAARPGDVWQVRPPHDDPVQDRQAAQLLLRGVLA